jgi:HEAT repeat protein
MILAAFAAGCEAERPLTAGGKPVQHWVEALKDPDARVRTTAVRKLGNVGTSDEAVLPALLGALGDRDAGVRREVILALVKLGPDARQAIPALTQTSERDPDSQVRTWAGKAAQRLRVWRRE